MTKKDTRVSVLYGDINLIPRKDVKHNDGTKAKVHVLQQSSVTGNRHEVRSGTSPIEWFTVGESEYLTSKTPFVIDHLGGDAEHGKVEVEAGTYEVTHQVEFDAIKQAFRSVID